MSSSHHKEETTEVSTTRMLELELLSLGNGDPHDWCVGLGHRLMSPNPKIRESALRELDALQAYEESYD